jgi:hypothetical protein
VYRHFPMCTAVWGARRNACPWYSQLSAAVALVVSRAALSTATTAHISIHCWLSRVWREGAQETVRFNKADYF